MKKLNLITVLALVLIIIIVACKKNLDLKITGPPCSFQYSGWTTCSNNIQTREYTSSPTGCSGTPPSDSISRSCVIPACIFKYSAWSNCSAESLQTRSYTSSPTGCLGTPPSDSLLRTCIPAQPTAPGTPFSLVNNLSGTVAFTFSWYRSSNFGTVIGGQPAVIVSYFIEIYESPNFNVSTATLVESDEIPVSAGGQSWLTYYYNAPSAPSWIAFRVKAKNSAGLESSFSNFSNWK